MWKGHEKVKVGVRSTEALVQKEEEDVKQLEQQAPNQIGSQESALYICEKI